MQRKLQISLKYGKKDDNRIQNYRDVNKNTADNIKEMTITIMIMR